MRHAARQLPAWLIFDVSPKRRVTVLALETVVHAPRERVFDLARSIDAHQDTAAATGEKAVAGVTSGLLGPEQEVTWQARHFGVT